MISDDARKVLAVAYNMYRDQWANYTRDMSVICKRAGRTELVVRAAFNELVKTGYLEHKDGLTLVIWASPLQREGYRRELIKRDY
ncbi:hypothetical protein ACX1C1_03860 [Paenibacillus sp. strain BS8-2]